MYKSTPIPSPLIHPTTTASFPLGVLTFVLYACVSISALQINHLYLFSRFCIYVFTYDICFSLFNSLYTAVSRATHVSTNDPVFFLLMAEKHLLFHIDCIPGVTFWVRAIEVYETDKIPLLLQLIS